MLSSYRTGPARPPVATAAAGGPEPATHLELRGLSKRYAAGGPLAVDDVSFTVRRGEFFGLLGPSGCGKTTTLNMIAGFVEPTEGRITLGGRDIVGMPPHRRGTAMVFQRYALFPHLTVAQNVAFGPKLRKQSRADVERRVGELLDFVGLGGMAGKFPDQLSGGQQQRVALARALAVDPEIVLLDEPLSNLDARMRTELRAELKRLLREAGVTVLIVTHDQAEAFSMCDRVAVMSDGTVQDVAAPMELYRRPRNPVLASFIGEGNFLASTVDAVAADGRLEVTATLGPRTHRLVVDRAEPDIGVGTAGQVLIRPEQLVVTAGTDGEVVDVSFLGPTATFVISVADRTLICSQPGHAASLAVGDRVSVDLSASGGTFVTAPGVGAGR